MTSATVRAYFASTSHTPSADRWGRQQQQSYITDLVYVLLYTLYG